MRSWRSFIGWVAVVVLCISVVVVLFGIAAPAMRADSAAGPLYVEPPGYNTSGGAPPCQNSSLSESPYLVRTFRDEHGRWVDKWIVPGRPPQAGSRSASDIQPQEAGASGDVYLSNVPAFDWCYGCSATSAAMLFGYYDNGDYHNM